MRRIIAILLLVAFSLPLIAASLQDSDANLPACCRRAGIHHCGGTGYGDAGTTNGPALKSGPCPSFLTTANLPAPPKITLPGTLRSVPAAACNIPAQPVRSRNRLSDSLDNSHPKRGPPSLR